MKCVSLICASLITSFLIFGCNPEDSGSGENCTPADNKMVELTTKLAGKTFKIGDTVKIDYKVDAAQTTGGLTLIKVTIDNGKNWSGFSDKGIEAKLSEGQFHCLSYNWVIGKENESVDYESMNNNCRLRICDYDKQGNYVDFPQETFTVTK